jgi:hypothetical protein
MGYKEFKEARATRALKEENYFRQGRRETRSKSRESCARRRHVSGNDCDAGAMEGTSCANVFKCTMYMDLVRGAAKDPSRENRSCAGGPINVFVCGSLPRIVLLRTQAGRQLFW